MTAYYNEHDAYCAQWLRNLISAGHIAPGVVDERSIEDVHPDDLREFTQCHFFAGVGVWSYALRQAGWTDDRPVWTGSCPCQPFSAAGKGAGFDDERHLWPAWQWLISQRSPSVLFGEQSAKAAEWLDLVRRDLEGMGYALGAMPIEAASAGAFHLRDRFWFVADTCGARLEKRVSNAGVLQEMAGSSERQDAPDVAGAGFAWFNGPDGKRRPFEPSIRPLADVSAGAVGRVRADQGHRAGRLKGYGNAINAQAAQEFIAAYMDA
jgi:DNA (cytosine-5)-methyltransferase 1